MSSTNPTDTADAPEFLLCRVPRELVERYGEDWQEAAAFRFRRIDGLIVEIEVATSLDSITAPEAS